MGETAPLENERRQEIEAVAKAMFGRVPERVAFPGGSSRSAFIADMGEGVGTETGLVVLAKRDDEADARLEATVLKGLAGSGHTPRFVARRGRWLAQECLPGPRLPVVLDRASPSEREARVAQALGALCAIHEAARSSGLVHRVAKLGVRPGWFADRIGEMNDAAALLGVAPAALDVAGISRVLDVKHRDFVKWDARPGNALVLPDAADAGGSRSIWFDWEDCGRHDAMDDIVCMLADEWCMLDVAAEERLLEGHLERFADRRSADAARHDFVVMALVQTGFRLRLAAGYYAKGRKFWNRDRCLAGDKVGVTASEMGRLVARSRRWASETKLTRPYLPMLEAIAERLDFDLARAA